MMNLHGKTRNIDIVNLRALGPHVFLWKPKNP